MDVQWQRLPWQDALWRQLHSGAARSHHALLLRGPAGIGKGRLARALVAASLCQRPADDGSACGLCDACSWLEAGNHPDFRRVSPAATLADEAEAESDGEGAEGKASEKKASQQITIEQIRGLAGFMSLTTHRGGARVLLVEPAEAMNLAAANALLKTLEEPPPGTRFVLVSSQPRRLPATVLSRCLPITLPLPAAAEACAWLTAQGVEDAAALLAQAAGRPLQALEAADPARTLARRQFLAQLVRPDLDPYAIAEKANRDNVALWAEWLQTWCHDLLRVRAGGAPRFHGEHQRDLSRLAQLAHAGRLLDWELRLRQARWESRQPVNARLYCDALLIDYRALFP